MEKLIDKLDPNREPGRLTFITRMGAGQDPRRAAAAARGDQGLRRDAALGHRPDARQRRHDADRLQDASLRRRRRRGARASSRRTAPRAPTRAASTSSSPATTSPSASAARSRSTRRRWRRRYESLCDPRLNHMQSLELAFLVAEELTAPLTLPSRMPRRRSGRTAAPRRARLRRSAEVDATSEPALQASRRSPGSASIAAHGAARGTLRHVRRRPRSRAPRVACAPASIVWPTIVGHARRGRRPFETSSVTVSPGRTAPVVDDRR